MPLPLRPSRLIRPWLRSAPPRAAAALGLLVAAAASGAGVAADPAFAWPVALEAAQKRREAAALRHALVDRWLARLEGQAAAAGQPAPSMNALIEAGTRAPPLAQQHLRWQALVQRHVTWVAPPQPVPVPPELEGSGPGLQTLGPGLWLQRAPDGSPRSAWLWLLLGHSAPAELALGDFVLEARVAPGAGQALRWQCTLPRYAELHVLPPGRPEPYLCRLPAADMTRPQDIETQLRALATAPSPLLKITVQAEALNAAVKRLEAAALALAPATVAAAATPPAASVAPPARPRPSRPQAPPAPQPTDWLGVLKGLGMAAAALGVYTLLHRLGGGVFAFFLTWAGSTGLAIATAAHTLPGVRAGLVAGSLAAGLLPALGWVAAVALPLAATTALAVVHALLFGAREVVLSSAQRSVERSMIDALRRWLDRALRR